MWRFGRYSERKKRKSPFSTTPLSFDAPLQWTPANIRIKLTLLETRIPGLHFCRWKYGSIFIQILVVGSETHVCNASECIIGKLPSKVISGSTKVVDFDTNRKRVFDFLLMINSNLCRDSHHFRDTAAYWSKIANSYPPHPHWTPSFGVTPFEFWDERHIPRN